MPANLYTPKGTTRQYVDATDVAAVCGVPATQLDFRFRPRGWAVPRDFRFEHGRLWFALLSLPELADELSSAGKSAGAQKLRGWLGAEFLNVFDADTAHHGHSRGVPALTATASTHPAAAVRVDGRRDWMARWEADHE